MRLFHWSLVILFTIAYFTGEEDSSLHIYSGYAVLGLVLFCIVWGGIGTKYARFGDFVKHPFVVIAYLKSLLSDKPKHYVGHNPAGGYMLIMILITTVTGIKVYGVEGHGPLANAVEISLISTAIADDDEKEDEHDGHENKAEEFWEEVHELAPNLTVFLIFIHIVGVIVGGRLHKENLVKAMISGKKQRKKDFDYV